MNQIKGFALSIIIVSVVFVISAFAIGIFTGWLGLWKKPFIGGFSAFCVVLAGYFSAPSHKLSAASIWLFVGAVTAWFLSGDSYYPEDHQHAYQLTFLPLAVTYASGILSLLLCFIWHKNKQAV